MRFEKLTHTVLQDLSNRGYNVLKSTSKWGDESPSFVPAQIDMNISEYLMKMDLRGKLAEGQHFLVIREALNIPESQLIGYVWIDED